MGWTYYSATHYNKHKIDRKAECDDIINNDSAFRLEKSALVGTTYYAAVTRIKKYENGNVIELSPEEQYTFAMIILTSVNHTLFGCKDMTESWGPCECDCPKSIIKLLSPTDNKYALEWRSNCLQKTADKATKLRNLPIDTVIETPDGHRYTKRPAGHQFKTPYWFDTSRGVYIPKKYIKDYTIVT